jgi:antitoxin VapB
MGKGLSIKNKETHRLAKELAALTGESITDALTIAIFEHLLSVKKEQGATLVEIMRTISDYSAPRFKPPYDTIDIDDLLYDELGLPK